MYNYSIIFKYFQCIRNVFYILNSLNIRIQSRNTFFISTPLKSFYQRMFSDVNEHIFFIIRYYIFVKLSAYILT